MPDCHVSVQKMHKLPGSKMTKRSMKMMRGMSLLPVKENMFWKFLILNLKTLVNTAVELPNLEKKENVRHPVS